MEITGWGKILKVGGEKKRSLSSPVSLQEAEVPIISQKSCQDDSVSKYYCLAFWAALIETFIRQSID